MTPQVFSHNSELDPNEPAWGSVDKTKLPRIAFAEQGEADKKTTWGYPHHHVKNGAGEDANGCYTTGTLYLNRGGLAAAWQRANQEGNSITAEAKAHLAAHRKAIGVGEENQSALPGRGPAGCRVLACLPAAYAEARAAAAAWSAQAAAKAKTLPTIKGSVAVLPVQGILTQRGDYWFGTSMDRLGGVFDEAIANEAVGALVLDVDSPGGFVYGTPELAAKVRAARGAKPIVAVANSLAASGAYWVASAAETLVVTPSGEVGSIGVYAVHDDWSGALAQAGIATTYIFAAPYKVEGNPDQPLTEEARAAIQADVDRYYQMFLADVAAGRGVKVSAVKADFGQGRTMMAQEALKAGMVDRVATLEQIIDELSGRIKARQSAQRAAELRELQLRTLQ